jgi:hypothetical protein
MKGAGSASAKASKLNGFFSFFLLISLTAAGALLAT